MERRCISIALSLVSLLVFAPLSYGAWIWTPQTGKWLNPKSAVKDTAQEQLQAGMAFYDAKDYKKAIGDFDKVVRFYPNSIHAPIAQYYIGRSYENMEEYFHSYLAYQKVVDTYPHAKNREEIIMRQYNIGVMFYEGKKATVMGLPILPAIDKGIEIFERVINNSPYGEYADKSQFKMGESYKKTNRFAEAAMAFQKLVNDYPKSNLVEQANYQVAECGYLASLGYSYDQETTNAAIDKFEDFLASGGGENLVGSAKESLMILKEKRAQGLFETAGFYEKVGKRASAIVYYKEVVDQYPESKLAGESLNRIMKLEQKMPKPRNET